MKTILNRVVGIEDYNGNIIMSFIVDDSGKIIHSNNMSVADIDNDYIYSTSKELIRLQQENNNIYNQMILKKKIKEKFIENFNTSGVSIDLMELVDEDKLVNYMINEFNDNFMYGELFDIFKDCLSKKELKILLEYMHHDFVDLDKLDDEEKDDYY